MAKYKSNPHPYAKTLSAKFSREFFILIFSLAGMGMAYWVTDDEGVLGVILGYATICLFIYLAARIFRQIFRNDRGELAEIKIKNVLMELPDSYTVFQNVPIKSNLDIDFVVVGPKGIFAVEVKSHLLVNFFSKRQQINQTFAETMQLKQYLEHNEVKTFIYPALVYTRALIRYEARKNGVCVTTPEYLLAYIYQANHYSFDKSKVEALVGRLYPQENSTVAQSVAI